MTAEQAEALLTVLRHINPMDLPQLLGDPGKQVDINAAYGRSTSMISCRTDGASA